MKRAAIFITCLAGLISCSDRGSPDVKEDIIINERDLVPEGLALDTRNAHIYVGSMFKRKIVRIDRDGNVSDFIREGQDGIWSVLGIEVDEERGHLWAVSSQANDMSPLKNPDSMQWRSALHCYDLSNGRLLKKVICADTAIFLNDLTVAPNGDVFITESMNSRLYSLPFGKDTIKKILTPSAAQFMNGLCLSPDSKYLFLGCWNGLLRVDLADYSYRWIKTNTGDELGGNDGLCWYDQSIISHQMDRVRRLHLDDTYSYVKSIDTLDQGKEYDISTTGELGSDGYYFIVNSQVQSAYDLAKKAIKPLDSLEKVIVRRIRLAKSNVE